MGTDSRQYTVGMSELVTGDTENFFNMIENMFTDMADLVEGENTNKKTTEILHSVKNMMSNCHMVNSALETELEVWQE